jgi:hypothetical protein
VPAGKLFVSVDLAMPPGTQLKDAVASFSGATGFELDPRFAEATGTLASSLASLRGWLPAARLAQAIQAPGVVRVEVDHGGPRPGGADAATSSLVIGLRLPSQGDSTKAFERVLGELADTAQLHWTRTIGFQSLPGSSEVALVIVGEVPVTRIPRLLAHPAVLKISPSPPAVPAAPTEQAASVPAPQSAMMSFLTFARRRAPLLLLFTALFLLPQVGELALSVVRAFVPYRR